MQTEEAEELATKAVDAVIAYAEQLALVGEVSALRARSENLRAALASIEARIDNVFALGTVPHPLREALGILRAAARGALEVDDKR